MEVVNKNEEMLWKMGIGSSDDQADSKFVELRDRPVLAGIRDLRLFG